MRIEMVWLEDIRSSTLVRKNRSRDRYEWKATTLDRVQARLSHHSIAMGGRHGDTDRWRWWVWPLWGSTEERTEGWRCGGEQTKRGIVVLFPPAVSHYSIKTPAATGALTVASIMTSAPFNTRPPHSGVYWVLVPLQCLSLLGSCVQQLAPPDPEPLKHLCVGVMRKWFIL